MFRGFDAALAAADAAAATGSSGIPCCELEPATGAAAARGSAADAGLGAAAVPERCPAEPPPSPDTAGAEVISRSADRVGGAADGLVGSIRISAIGISAIGVSAARADVPDEDADAGGRDPTDSAVDAVGPDAAAFTAGA